MYMYVRNFSPLFEHVFWYMAKRTAGKWTTSKSNAVNWYLSCCNQMASWEILEMEVQW